jgi:hypothetical protein
MEEAPNTAHGEARNASRWPTLVRLGVVPESLRRARGRAALRRGAVETLCAQLVLLPACALLSAARPYEAVWLQAALATWALWLWPLFRWFRAARGAGDGAALAEELDHLNPAAPDVFRTARTVFDPGVHSPGTRDALESLFRSWEPRLRIPEPPLLGAARRRALVVSLLWTALAAAAPLVLSSRLPFLSGRHPGTVLYRMALPLRAWNEIPAPRLTPGIVRDRIVHGDTLVVGLRMEHVPRARAVFARLRTHLRAGSPEVRYALVRQAAGDSAIFRFGPVTEDLTLRFAAGSALTRAYRIRVVTPPRLRALSAVITPPAYTRLPPEVLPEFPPAYSVLPGTRIAWRAEAERSLRAWTASFARPDASPAREDAAVSARKGGGDPDGVAQGSGARFAFALTVRHAADLTLGLTDHEDEGGARAVEGPWRIELKADEPPEIVLLAPASENGEGELARGLKVPLLFRARDDFGISRVRIRYALRADGEEDLRAEGSRDITPWLSARDGTGGGVWDAAVLRPQPGDVVEIFLEALDNDAVSGPKAARSATVRLRLPSAEEVRAAVEARERGASTSLSSALERERRMRREAERPDRAQTAEAPPAMGEWEARRILSDGPRQHLQELRRQLEQEKAAESGAKEAKVANPSANPSANPPANLPTAPDKARAALQAEVQAMEKRLPSPEVARAPVAAQMKALESLNRDQRALERKLAETRPPVPGQEALRENRRRLEDDLQRNLKEQKDLQSWLQERGRMEAGEKKRAEEASRNAARLEQDVDNALEQLKEAMEKGVENGTLTPDMLEKMDRVRELLEEVLDENEKERLRREAGEEAPDAGDMQRAMQELLEPKEEKDGLRRDLERAIRMLETMRDLRALRDLTGTMRALEGEQRELAGEMEADAPKDGETKEAAALAARQEALQKRLDKAVKDMDRLSKNPAMSSLAGENGKEAGKDNRKESARDKAGKARDAMEKTAGQLKQKDPNRRASREGADLAARHLKAAVGEMEKMAARLDAGANLAEIRAVLEETLEFSRWLEVGGAVGGAAGGGVAADAAVLARGGYPYDAQGVVRVAKWLGSRMERIAAAQAFESEALRRETSFMMAQADALATSGSGAAREGLGRHARGAARELLKLLNKPQNDGGSEDGDGKGDTDFSGGDQGESGQEGLTGRMRGVSGKQMAANRLTQELLRSLLEGRRQGGSSGTGGRGGSGGKNGSKGQGDNGSSAGGSSPSSPQTGGSPGGESGGGDEGGESGERAGGNGGDGGAANAQQNVANALESLAESADDAGGAARKLRQLAEEARALERALRGERLDPGTLQKRQEQFRTRLLEAANALEERGQQRERRAEAYAGGLLAPEGPALPAGDSLAAEIRRRREEARKLPLSPGQKRRVEWYYERLLAP